jgi:hypothetical protein
MRASISGYGIIRLLGAHLDEVSIIVSFAPGHRGDRSQSLKRQRGAEAIIRVADAGMPVPRDVGQMLILAGREFWRIDSIYSQSTQAAFID